MKGVLMKRILPILTILLTWTGAAHAHGLLIPADRTLPPLAMVNHKVAIDINDQVATTRVDQTFRNHTDRRLEATYIFPVPKGASVNKFTMWVNGKEVGGEMVEAAKARQIYTDIVRQTQDPGLLEYMGQNLLRMRVFPIEPRSEQRVALNFSSVAPRDGDLVEYVYPLKTDGKATRTLEDFSVKATIKSQHPIQNVYSPTHAINLTRAGDKEVTINFERNQALLDKDFQLYYSLGDKDVGLTLLAQRPISSENGHFMLLLSPRVEMSKSYHIPRDLVLVLDTSGSMAGEKMEQARKALKHVLGNLNPQDRFGLINFSTTVNKYRDGLVESDKDRIEHAKKWVDNLQARGGTAINDALLAALQMRSDDAGRSFTVVFFTDGQPTIGETDCDKILKNIEARNSANTRIFTFGVGHDDGINATFLDQLADRTRALSTFIQPGEDIEVKTASLYNKISHPVLANLKLSVGDKVHLEEVYPPQLPDLFHGGQVVVLGRYTGSGPVAVKLTGSVGKETHDFVYEVNFPAKTDNDKDFVEQVWARRKVGYLLDQVRVNGEKKELVDEVVALSKKYGIATPYTSYLIVPDAMPVANGRRATGFNMPHSEAPRALATGGPGQPAKPVSGFIKELEKNKDAKDAPKNADELGAARGRIADADFKAQPKPDPKAPPAGDGSAKGGGKSEGKGDDRYEALREAAARKKTYDEARKALQKRDKESVQTGELGVNLSVRMNNLRNQTRLEQSAVRRVANRNVLEIGGIWIDEGFDPKMKTVTVRAMSDAYFRILQRHPEIKDVFRLGNHLVWVTPSNTALVIDLNDGKDKLSDEEIDGLFVAKK
jgi:Ca-activated chloride channel family protein